MFRVGQMVVCIVIYDASKDITGGCVTRWPQKGEVLTIREIYEDPVYKNMIGLRFEEIVCGIHSIYPVECGFGSDDYRPVKETSIDLFHEIALKTSNNTPVLEPV